MSVPGRGALAVLVALGALCVANRPAQAQDAPIPGVIQPGHEEAILSLVQPLPAGVQVVSVSVGERGFRFDLTVVAEPVSVVVDLDAEPTVTAVPPPEELPDEARGIAAELVDQVRLRTDDAFWDRVLTRTSLGGAGGGDSRVASPAVVALSIYSALLLIVASMGRRRAVDALGLTAVAIAPVFVLATGMSGTGGEGRMVVRDTVVWVMLVAAIQLVWVVGRGSWRVVRRAARYDTPERTAVGAGPDSALPVDVCVVLAWSLLVRFGLTTPNVLTDGGSLRSRLLAFSPDFGGMAVLLDFVLPGARQIDDAIFVFTALSALAPVGVVLVAYGLSLPRLSRVIGGLALASWPVHAALFASDFESGPTMSVTIVGAGLLLIGLRYGKALSATVGASLVAFALWGRPEALVVGLPILGMALWTMPGWAREPRVLAGLVWLGFVAGLRLVLIEASDVLAADARSGGVFTLVRSVPAASWGNFTGSTALVPPWLYLAPVGIVAAARRAPMAALVVLLGLLSGAAPIAISGAPSGLMRFIEAFRYGAFAMPWLAVGVGMALAWIAGELATALSARWRGPWHAVAAAAAVASVVVVPLAHRDYLARQYGPNVEREAFLDMSQEVDPACYIVVPDDVGETGPDGSNEIAVRYPLALVDASLSGRATFPARHVVGISAVLRELGRAEGSGNRAATTPPSPGGTVRTITGDGAADLGEGCWYFFRGLYCDDGAFGVPPSSCSELLERVEHTSVLTHEFAYRHHRLVASPKHTDRPWFDPERRLVLYRLVGLGDR